MKDILSIISIIFTVIVLFVTIILYFSQKEKINNVENKTVSDMSLISRISQLETTVGVNTANIGVNSDAITNINISETNKFFDAAVDTGHYSSVYAAIADGKKRIKVSMNVTETTNWSITTDIFVYIVESVTLTIGDIDINVSNDASLTIEGTDRKTSKLVTDKSVSATTVDISGIGKLNMKNLTYINNSSANNSSLITSTNALNMNNCIVYASVNVNNSGLNLNSAETVLSNCELFLNGTFTSRTEPYKFSKGNYNNIVMDLSNYTNAGSNPHLIIENSLVNNLFVRNSTVSNFYINLVGGTLSNVKYDGASSNTHLLITDDNSILNNCSIDGDLTITSSIECQLTNVKCADLLLQTTSTDNMIKNCHCSNLTTASSSDNNIFDGIKVSTDLTIATAENKLTNITCDGTTVISANYNKITSFVIDTGTISGTTIISNGIITSAITISSNSNLLSNILFSNTLTLEGTHNKIDNCDINILSIDSASTNNIINNCDIRDASTIDSESNILNNVLFRDSITLDDNDNQFTGCDIFSIVITSNSKNNRINNCTIRDTITINSASSGNNFSSLKIIPVVDITSNNNSLVNCHCLDNLTISGDRNVLSNTIVTDDEGSGSGTATFDVSGSNNIITNSQSDIAINDTGSSNTVDNNSVF